MSSTTFINLALVGDQARALTAALSGFASFDSEKVGAILPPLPTPSQKDSDDEDDEDDDDEDDEESEEEPELVIPPLEIPVLKQFLFEIVFGQNIFFEDATDKEIENYFSVIIALADNLEQADSQEILSGLTKTVSSSTERSLLRLKLLNSIYNIYGNNSAARFQTLLTLLNYARDAKHQDIVVAHLDRIEASLPSWTLSASQTRDILRIIRSIYNDKKKTIRSYSVLVELLKTYTAEDVAGSVDEAVEAAVLSIQFPEITQFDHLLAIPSIAQLESKNSAVFKILNIFTSGSLTDLATFKSQSPDFFTTHGISIQDAENKIRLLTVCSAAEKSQELSFEEIAGLLELSGEDVEDDVEYWIVSAISAGLIDAKINQLTQTVAITRANHRVFGTEQWKALDARISTWKDNISELVKIVKSNQNSLKESAARQFNPSRNSKRPNTASNTNQRRNQEN
eukprot:TRINITY_DN4030_c0_g1_i1.p2 TRINITY_DN4030_c0_g1~~TRINITY_DN4030_c0_g1_i1.p2  ORF type:complete len:455 (+),score=238.60 TRINITY_DN4030_c0_g1_i1:37-1401(+)